MKPTIVVDMRHDPARDRSHHGIVSLQKWLGCPPSCANFAVDYRQKIGHTSTNGMDWRV
jgi:hypothetical protein